LALLITAYKQGKITLETIIEKCYTNPRKIFNLPEQEDTYIEIGN
jgi:carbamoyl-phosphate synthase/aspartate carbamoyltransferase/dihydroorotase